MHKSTKQSVILLFVKKYNYLVAKLLTFTNSMISYACGYISYMLWSCVFENDYVHKIYAGLPLLDLMSAHEEKIKKGRDEDERLLYQTTWERNHVFRFIR